MQVHSPGQDLKQRYAWTIVCTTTNAEQKIKSKTILLLQTNLVDETQAFQMIPRSVKFRRFYYELTQILLQQFQLQHNDGSCKKRLFFKKNFVVD